MRTAVASALVSLSLVACIQPHDDPHPVARAIPTADDVKIELPDRSNRTVGEIAEWYVATRDVTRGLNGATAWVLIVVHTIVQFPPTSESGGTYTWGPWSDALDPAEYRLDVSQATDGSYDWALSGRNKTEVGSVFEIVIEGNAIPSEPEGRGSGSFTIDFDASRRVNPIDAGDERGTVDVVYDLADKHLDMDIATTEDRDGVATPVAYTYSYDEATDRSGNMVFQIHADSGDEGTLAEDVTLRSRWSQDGSGRSDIRLENGDFGTLAATGAQCWDTNFRTVYSEYSFDATLSEGDEADCAYATASLPQ
jgi:hypothetical protein